MFTISEALQINAVIWIRSLPEQETGPSNRIIEDLALHCRENQIHFEKYDVESAHELDQILNRTASAAADGLRPIIHFDGHGARDLGLCLSESEHYSWQKLADNLRTINLATKNNLTCIFATCYGYNICLEVNLLKATPFYLLVAPPKIVTIGFLENYTMEFYRNVSETKDITRAFRENLSRVMTLYHCQGIFLESLSDYVAQSCKGAAKRLRVEDVLTRSLKQHGISEPNRNQIRQHRSHIKKMPSA